MASEPRACKTCRHMKAGYLSRYCKRHAPVHPVLGRVAFAMTAFVARSEPSLCGPQGKDYSPTLWTRIKRLTRL